MYSSMSFHKSELTSSSTVERKKIIYLILRKFQHGWEKEEEDEQRETRYHKSGLIL